MIDGRFRFRFSAGRRWTNRDKQTNEPTDNRYNDTTCPTRRTQPTIRWDLREKRPKPQLISWQLIGSSRESVCMFVRSFVCLTLTFTSVFTLTFNFFAPTYAHIYFSLRRSRLFPLLLLSARLTFPNISRPQNSLT